MGTLVHFGLMFLLVTTVVGLTAIGWPKLTSRPRPEPLTKVGEIISQTPLGQNLASVLGVTDETVEPINLGNTAASVAGSLTAAFSRQAQQVIVNQIVRELAKQYQELPAEQKQELKQIICKPD